MKHTWLLLAAALLSIPTSLMAKVSETVEIDVNKRYQTIHSFGASDCWRTQFIGENWPIEKREQMADWLFSTQMDSEGNPEGIGLSLWRFNIGAGSHDAGDKSGVGSQWRRTEVMLDENGNWDSTKQAGQRWFLQAAKDRGVKYSLGFSIAAPYYMSINGMARGDKNHKYANIKETEYANYADYMVRLCDELGIDYLSPINEPQWEWVSPRQEGTQATNRECSRLIHYIDESVEERESDVKVVFGEAGDIRYLYRAGTDKPGRDNQVNEIFSKSGVHSISGLSSVAPVVTGHSYWSTWPMDTLITTREQLRDSIATILPKDFTYWQTEFCPMEKNDENPNGGGKRDLGMNTALYISRIIHADLVKCNAASWQSWTAFSEANYKDGLIFIDNGISVNGATSAKDPMLETCKSDGVFRDSKYMWSLGNFSRFIRPGMVRVNIESSVKDELKGFENVMTSAYVDPENGKLVIVLINYADEKAGVDLSFVSSDKYKKFRRYETSDKYNLAYRGVVSDKITLSPRSIVTLVSK